MPTNPPNNAGEHAPPAGDFVDHPDSGPGSVQAGYETTDANARGVIIFLGGLFGFVIIFFFFCYLMGRVINHQLEAEDGPTSKWHQQNDIFAGAKSSGGKREDLKSSSAMEQQQFAKMTQAFPNPRLDADDGNQSTADLHAREDLYLNHYSTAPGETAVRIPITRAMELIAERGLPTAAAAAPGKLMAGDDVPTVQLPLTSGFARTGYELDTIEARKQRMDFGKASENEHAELKSAQR